MKEYKFSELFDLQMGKTPSRNEPLYWEKGDNKWISISDLTKSNKYISDTKEKLSDQAIKETGIKLIPKNTVVMSFKLSIGKVAITEEDMYSNEAIMAFHNKGICNIDSNYLYYLLLSKDWEERTNKAVMGKTLNKATLSSMIVKIHDLDEQYNIVNNLDFVSKLIEKRKHQLVLIDNLIKSRFIELFGDVKTNEFGWKKCRFGDVAVKITDGEHGTVPRVNKDEGYLYFMARNITKNGEIDLSETSYVPKEVHEKVFKRCNPEQGDILLVCVGATIGKSTIVPQNMGAFSMARSVALIKPDAQKVNNVFLHALLKSDAIQNDISNCAHAAAQAGLYTNMIINLDAFVPPMELQEQFAAFVEQTDKSKFISVDIITQLITKF